MKIKRLLLTYLITLQQKEYRSTGTACTKKIPHGWMELGLFHTVQLDQQLRSDTFSRHFQVERFGTTHIVVRNALMGCMVVSLLWKGAQ